MYFGTISTTEDDELSITTFDDEKEISNYYVHEKYESTKSFVADIPRRFCKNQYKAFILQILRYECSEYSNSIEFCKAVRKQFDATGIPYHFTVYESFYSSFLVAAKILPTINKSILCILPRNEDHFGLIEFVCTEKGYVITCDEKLYNPYNDKVIQEKIIDRRNSVIIVITLLPDDDEFIRKLQSKCFDSCLLKLNTINVIAYFMDQATIEFSKWIFDKSYIKYAILPTCARKYAVMSDYKNDPIITAEKGEQLPFKKSCMVKKSKAKYTLAMEDKAANKSITIEQIDLPSKCHQFRISLIVDSENFPSCEIKPHLIREIVNLPSTLNESMDSKVPVIAFWNNSSVICVHKDDEEGYQFLDGWNGQFGEELYVSFDEEKPKYNQKAAILLDSKPASVVFDFIKLLSFPSFDNIETDDSWKFKITKDGENPILIEIKNFDGTSKLATPTFMMALILKEHLKIIKTEIGEKPKELAFWIFDHFQACKFSGEEKQQIKNGLPGLACEG